MIKAALLGTGRVLPGRPVSTDEVAERAIPRADPKRLTKLTGIVSRNWVEAGTRSAPIAADALRQALSMAGLKATDLRRIIFASSAGGDWLTPSTASRVAHELELSGQCECFDVNNGCLGFLSAFDVAARSVATGLGPVGVVAVEIFSDVIAPEEPRCYTIFGDAAGAVVLGTCNHEEEGILGVSLHTDPTPGLTVMLDHPRWSGRLSPGRFGMGNLTMMQAAVGFLVSAAHEALRAAELTMEDVDWVLPHQPNGYMFDRIVESLNAPPERTLKIVHEIGSTGAASIPYSLDLLVRSGRVKRSDKILMTSVGAGASYGAVVLRVGSALSGIENLRL